MNSTELFARAAARGVVIKNISVSLGHKANKNSVVTTVGQVIGEIAEGTLEVVS